MEDASSVSSCRSWGTQKLASFLAKFKICAKGTTDWVPMILGARAIDCKERGGLGFIPGPAAHGFTALGILVERADRDCPRMREALFFCGESSCSG